MITEAIIISIISSFFSLAIGLGVAFFVHYLQNRPSVIRRKTREEAIQKLKLDSIIEIINKIKEFKSETIKLKENILSFRDMTKSIQNSHPIRLSCASAEVIKFISRQHEFQEMVQSLRIFIINFKHLLENDMEINENEPVVKNAIKVIENKFIEIFDALKSEELTEIKPFEIMQGLDEANNDNSFRKIKKSINKILKIYRRKLN